MIEIDATTSTAVAVFSNFGQSAFEGIEYSPSLGGIFIASGNTTAATNRLFLLNNSYAAIASNLNTGILDGDTLFLDGHGGLNLLDTNNPYNGWQRNLITNPFTSISITPNGLQNSFTMPDVDAAWKADENALFLTRTTSLARIVGPNNLFAVGPYGGGTNITGIAVGPPIPEPTTAAVVVLGSTCVTRRRRRAPAADLGMRTN